MKHNSNDPGPDASSYHGSSVWVATASYCDQCRDKWRIESNPDFCFVHRQGGYGVVRFRAIVGMMAMLGVLLHAGLLVRHNAMMLNAKFLNQELAAALGVICHSDGSTSQLAGSDAPALPEPLGNQGDCPLCMGLMSAAILPTYDAPSFVPDLASARIAVIAEAIAPRLTAVCPPSRGPPAIV